MSKNIPLLATVLLFGAYAFYTNSKFNETNDSFVKLRTEIANSSKKPTNTTTTVITQKTIEHISDSKEADKKEVPQFMAANFDPLEGRRQADQNAERLQQIVYSEAKDAVWDDLAENELRKLDSEISGSSIRELECRQTMCYVDVVHDNMQALQNWSLRSGLNPDSIFRKRLSIRFDEPDGKFSTRIFLVREGNDLPPNN